MDSQDLKIAGCSRICAQIDLDAMKQNILEIRSKTGENVKIMAVIKTDAYGHGCVPVAGFLEENGLAYGFAVATAAEAFQLRESGIRLPILILGYTFPEDYERLVREEIRMTVFREDSLEKIADAAGKAGKNALVHIKVDTGMTRIGVMPDNEGLSFVRKIAGFREITVEGIFTHFACADETDKENAYEQFGLFREFCDEADKIYGMKIPVKHCANSAAILEMSKTHMDMVRAGIILYGLWPSDEIDREKVNLSPVMSLYSKVVYVRKIKKGTRVSYGGTFTAPEDMMVATVPVGYGDGYPRSLSGKGYVLIRGKKAPILGRICMDQFMVDVTSVPEVSNGDHVTLLGRDGDQEITAQFLGELSGRFNYELVCDIGRRVPRVFVQNGKATCVVTAYEEIVVRMQES